MMVANSFDLWQKDIFFSAAEEVQQSTDTMESAYRLWIKQGNGVSINSDELQAALSTAKWQLEEFEKAIRLTHHGRCCRDDTSLMRHKQFVTAIENQIYRVESDLKENGKKSTLRFDLNKEERDDLAMFLSGTSQSFGNEIEREGPECVIDVEEERESKESSGGLRGTRRTWSSPNVGALRISVPKEEEEERKKLRVDDTPKEKGYKTLFWMRQRFQIFDTVGCYQRRFRVPFSRSIQFVVSLMLILFLLCLFL